ncbi:MAG TPA: FecR domain-containing protein [Rhizomicrobium sp.]
MSAHDDDNATFVDARDIEALAADWFGRRQFWNWKPEEQAELDVWLNSSLAHRVAYWRLEAAWSRTERLVAVRQFAREPVAPAAGKRKWSKAIWIVAGAVAIAAIALLGVRETELLRPGMQTYSTSVGETRTLALADGSRIELNTDTVLRANRNGKSRIVELEKGEAFFQIHHNKAHPFIVLAAGHRVTDLGTKFLVRHDGSRVQVTLVEGRARIDTADTGMQPHSAMLTPGDVAVATADSMSVTKGSPQELTDTLSWRSGMLIFDNMTLGDAAAEFNRYNKVQLVIVGSSVGRTPIAGKFPIDGVDRFAEVVKHVFGLRVASEHGAMVISR